jgi:hypothetical protein
MNGLGDRKLQKKIVHVRDKKADKKIGKIGKVN